MGIRAKEQELMVNLNIFFKILTSKPYFMKFLVNSRKSFKLRAKFFSAPTFLGLELCNIISIIVFYNSFVKKYAVLMQYWFMVLCFTAQDYALMELQF